MSAESSLEFVGNQQDLEQFSRLASSPIRSEQREIALREWDSYKSDRQNQFVTQQEFSFGGKPVKHEPGRKDLGLILQAVAPAIDLRGARFPGLCLGYVDMRGARLDDASFTTDQGWAAMKGAQFMGASLARAQMPNMRLIGADFRSANLTGANLVGADLSDVNFGGAILRDACLEGASLERANLVGADVEGATLDGARVYGVSAWDLKGRPSSSRDLIVTRAGAIPITVDDIRVAQLIHMFLNNPEIRDVLDTVTQKVVLILGRFTPERKAVLDVLRNELRSYDFVPILFDFDKPSDRDTTETVTLLARMARFVIADLTDPASIAQELEAIVPHVELPIVLIIAEGQRPYSMSKDLQKYNWVIRPYRYESIDDLISNVRTKIIEVAEAKRTEILRRRAAPEW